MYIILSYYIIIVIDLFEKKKIFKELKNLDLCLYFINFFIGTVSRIVVFINMNVISSRVYIVVIIIFDQIIKSESGFEIKKSSVMNLVDLVGFERVDSTGVTGDRFKEGVNINKFLFVFGNVIFVSIVFSILCVNLILKQIQCVKFVIIYMFERSVFGYVMFLQLN